MTSRSRPSGTSYLLLLSFVTVFLGSACVWREHDMGRRPGGGSNYGRVGTEEHRDGGDKDKKDKKDKDKGHDRREGDRDRDRDEH
jgi:hypothetical protein